MIGVIISYIDSRLKLEILIMSRSDLIINLWLGFNSYVLKV